MKCRTFFILVIILLSTIYHHAYAEIVIDPDVEVLNDNFLVDFQVQPFLNLTSQVDVTDDHVQLDNRWFNLSSVSGLVAANLTYWDSARVTFMIHNDSLTDLYAYLNGTAPQYVYLDEVSSPSQWSVISGITTINATSSRNITLTWGFFYVRLYYETGVSSVSFNGTLKANGSLTAVQQNYGINVSSLMSAGYNFSHYDFCWAAISPQCNRSTDNPEILLFLISQNATLYSNAVGGSGPAVAQWGILLLLFGIPAGAIFFFYYKKRG